MIGANEVCVVCDKPLTRGLYNEDSALFCTVECATFFARAVLAIVYLPGEDYRKIYNWLGEFDLVAKRRKRSGGRH